METEIPDSLEPIRNRAINRPKYRGVLHSYCFFISIPAGILLVATAPSAAGKFASFAFAFGISAKIVLGVVRCRYVEFSVHVRGNLSAGYLASTVSASGAIHYFNAQGSGRLRDYISEFHGGTGHGYDDPTGIRRLGVGG